MRNTRAVGDRVKGLLAFCVLFCAFAAFSAAGEKLAPFPTWSEPRAVTQGPHEHLLASYFAIDSWSPNKRYMLVLETDVNGRLPEAGERCTLGVVDMEDDNLFIPVTTTACWNFQEAAMAFWMNDDEILFNDLRDGKFSTVIMNWRTKQELRVLPMPVSAVSEDRTWAVSVNYARLFLLRPDYGYAGPGQDPRASVPWPEDDGLWTMDLRTGETKLILSVAATRALQPEPKVVPGKPGQPLAYHCHTVISKDGEKIFFLARSVDWFNQETHEIPYWNTTSFTVNRDGSELRRCFKDGWAGSHFNWAPDGSHKMLVTVTWNERNDPEATGHAWTPVEFEVGKENEVRRIGDGILDLDWHCIYSPDGKFMSGETYWNKYYERPWVLVRLADGMTMPMGSFYVPVKYRQTYWRCDLHARYRPDGRQIAFNSVHEGSRQVYVRDCSVQADSIAITNAGFCAEIDASLGGRVISFGHKGGRNFLWRDESVRHTTDPKEWKNVGGEKTWVGSNGDWGRLFGRKPGYPPPQWFDGAAFEVSQTTNRVAMTSPVSNGERWKVKLHREVFFEGQELVIRSQLETLEETKEPLEGLRNWSLTQIAETDVLAVHLTDRKRAEWGQKKGEAPAPIRQEGDWLFYRFEDFGVTGLMNFDADALAAHFEDGWLMVRHRPDPKTCGSVEKPRSAVFHSGLREYMKGDLSKRYIELEFFGFGTNASMDVLMSVVEDPVKAL